MNEEYANEAETTTAHRATLDRKAEQARARRARKDERRRALTILDEMNVFKVQKAVGRAYRAKTTTTKDGRVRRYRIGGNVASMVSWLLYWEGRGELDGGWIHKSEPEWEEETDLTPSKIRTARRVGKAEGLWEEEEHLRSDYRVVVKYRVNVWRVLQVANASEIRNTEKRLERARNHPTKHDSLERELERLEATRDDLDLLEVPVRAAECRAGALKDDPRHEENEAPQDEEASKLADPPANLTTHACENSGDHSSIYTDYRGALQEERLRGCRLQRPFHGGRERRRSVARRRSRLRFGRNRTRVSFPGRQRGD